MRSEQEHRFSSEDEAKEFAQRRDREYRAYDCRSSIRKDEDSGKWVVTLSMVNNCN